MIGMICRMDKSGLGQGQTLRLARLIKPDKIMLINSFMFNGSKQYPEWYNDYDCMTVQGFPNVMQIRKFLSGLKKMITCETFYSPGFTTIARSMGVETICIANPEFFDWFKPSFKMIPKPNKVIVPSVWMLRDMKMEFNAEYLPTPIFEDEFAHAREVNLKRKGKRRYLFINGKTASHDRNGLESLYEALELSRGKFEIVVKSQGDIKKHPDPRLIYDQTNPDNPQDLYTDFDALILPRRYAGQSLPMCEALQSGLPVVMTDISPNNYILPEHWLVSAKKYSSFMARIPVDVYRADPLELAELLNSLDVCREVKQKAIEIGKQYDAETLRPQYEALLS